MFTQNFEEEMFSVIKNEQLKQEIIEAIEQVRLISSLLDFTCFSYSTGYGIACYMETFRFSKDGDSIEISFTQRYNVVELDIKYPSICINKFKEKKIDGVGGLRKVVKQENKFIDSIKEIIKCL